MLQVGGPPDTKYCISFRSYCLLAERPDILRSESQYGKYNPERTPKVIQTCYVHSAAKVIKSWQLRL